MIRSRRQTKNPTATRAYRGNRRVRAHSFQRGEEILALLRRHGPLPVGALADHLPISPAAVRWQVKRLEAAGAVTARLETAEERQARIRTRYASRGHRPRLLLYRAAP